MRTFRLILLIPMLCIASCARHAAPPRERPLMLSDVDGQLRAPLVARNRMAVLVIFIGAECPISNSYAPEITRLCEQYEPRGVGFYCVYADSDLSTADARRQAREYDYRCPVLLDPHHELARRLGATVTPEAFVLGPDSKVMYRGRIDDQWAALGRRRHDVTSHDLRAALDAVLAGRPVHTPITVPVGCRI